MKMFKGMALEHINLFPERPTLVMLHDSLGCITLWRDFPKKLAEATQCNLLLYDRIGYGQSQAMETAARTINYLALEADVLNDLLKAMDISNAILFGHSDGGSIALITAGKYPDRIKAVIVEAAHIFVEEITLKGIRVAKEAYQNTDLSKRLEKYHGNKTDTLFKAWTETWLSLDFSAWNIEYLLKGIHCPLLFIQGEQDEYGTLDQVKRTIALVSGKATSCIIPNVGHTPHKESPNETLSSAEKFIVDILG